MTRVNKKLREAAFFLGKMEARHREAFGDREEFDFYLSAFLCATRSIDYRLRHEQGSTYEKFRESWDGTLTTDKRQLAKFMVDDRNLEVHESGSARAEGEERIPIPDSYSDPSGTVTVFAPPGTPPAEVIKPDYFFIVDGKQVPVLELSRTYLSLLDRLVREYSRHITTP